MRPEAPPLATLGFDAFGAAAGLGVISGALAILVPFLTVLTGTLVALGLAAWSLGRSPHAGGRRAASVSAGGSAVAVGLAATGLLYLLPPAPYAPFRALGLALALVALWTREARARRPAREAPR